MSDNWYSFDAPTIEERERDQAVAEIAALEKQVLDACHKIKAAGEKRP